jgi:hypothetical protein
VVNIFDAMHLNTPIPPFPQQGRNLEPTEEDSGTWLLTDGKIKAFDILPLFVSLVKN